MHNSGSEQRLTAVFLSSQRVYHPGGKSRTRLLPRVHGQVLHYQCALLVRGYLGSRQAVLGRGDGQQDQDNVHRPQGRTVETDRRGEFARRVWRPLHLRWAGWVLDE